MGLNAPLIARQLFSNVNNSYFIDDDELSLMYIVCMPMSARHRSVFYC